MIKCLCFMRVSSLKQDLTAQRKAVLSAARKDYSPSEIIEVQGKESAIKLDEMERQTLNEMKTVVEEYPSIEAIYFFSVDRLARKMSVVMSIKDWADRRQINLVFLNPCPFSTWFKIDGILKKNDISDIYLMFLSFGAKMEMEIKSERFAAAKTLNKEHNKPNGPILYGYTTDANKNLIIDRNSARVIRWIFDCYLKKNMSTTEIYNEGIELGYWQDLRERTAKANRIRHILRNYCYAGRPNKGGLVYPAIVDEEEIDDAIRIMTQKINQPKHTRTIYLCKGYIRDETSGYMLIPNSSHIVYQIKQNIEEKYGLSMNVADSLIWRTAYGSKWILLSNADNNQKEKIEQQLIEIKNKIDNLNLYIKDNIDSRISKAYDAFVNGKGRITQEMYNNTINNLDNEHKKYKNKITELEKRERELYNILDELNQKEKRDISIFTIKDIKDDKQRAEIIKECITNMTVRKICKRRYIIKVYTILREDPERFYYINRGKVNELYCINGYSKDEEDNIDVKAGLLDGHLIPIEDEIEKRFTK